MAEGDSEKLSLESYPLGSVLITGGSGGLANQILELLASRRASSQLHSVDLRAPTDPIRDVMYHTLDLTSESSVRSLLHELRPNVVIHCASPRYDASKEAMQKVNIDGTRVLVDTSKDAGVSAFVYTSSASVVSDGKTDLRGADETYPLVTGDEQPEFYVNTKIRNEQTRQAIAEIYVLSQNRPASHPNFLTCAPRPSGIFGIGDSWVLPGIIEAYDRGQTKVQLGDDSNLFEFTENTNVAHAHHLAAAALLQSNADGCQDTTATAKVDGEAFFITNDEPVPFWDFTRMAWKFAGDTTKPGDIWVISRFWAMCIAGLLEWIFWLLRLGPPPLTRQKVRLSCMTRYYSIEKAKQRLSYKPSIGLQEGLQRGVRDCLERRGRLNSQANGKDRKSEAKH